MTTEGTPLRQARQPDPLQCDQGCYPPHDPFYLGSYSDGEPEYVFQNETYSYQDGDRWVCPHGAAYVALSNRDPGMAPHRNWYRLHGRAERRARRDAGQEVEPGVDLPKIARLALGVAAAWLIIAVVCGALYLGLLAVFGP